MTPNIRDVHIIPPYSSKLMEKLAELEKVECRKQRKLMPSVSNTDAALTELAETVPEQPSPPQELLAECARSKVGTHRIKLDACTEKPPASRADPEVDDPWPSELLRARDEASNSVCVAPSLCCPGQQGVRWQGFQVWRCGQCTGSHHLLKQRSAPTPPCRPWQQGWTVAPPTPMQDPSVDASTCKTNHSALQSWWTWNLKNRKKQRNRQFQDYTAQHSYVSTSAICNCTYLGICQRIYILHVKALYTCYDRKYLSTKMWLWYAWNRDRSQLRRTNWWCKWWWSNINSMMFDKKTPSWK